VRELRTAVERAVALPEDVGDQAPGGAGEPAPQIDVAVPFPTAKQRLVDGFERGDDHVVAVSRVCLIPRPGIPRGVPRNGNPEGFPCPPAIEPVGPECVNDFETPAGRIY
jgi:hypothetical protein